MRTLVSKDAWLNARWDDSNSSRTNVCNVTVAGWGGSPQSIPTQNLCGGFLLYSNTMQYMGHTSQIIIAYLIFSFNWVSSTLSVNPTP